MAAVENKDRITLGSGKLFYQEFTGEIPENTAIETESNRLGYIQGGATLEYKPTYYTAKDDLGIATKTIITEEEATLKSGILTFNGGTLGTLCETARVTEDKIKGLRIVKVGGASNANGKRYLIHFLHEDATDGNVRVTIVGKNEAGFSLAFTKDKETVLDAEFKAQSMDAAGTLIIYQEDIPVTVSE